MTSSATSNRGWTSDLDIIRAIAPEYAEPEARDDGGYRGQLSGARSIGEQIRCGDPRPFVRGRISVQEQFCHRDSFKDLRDTSQEDPGRVRYLLPTVSRPCGYKRAQDLKIRSQRGKRLSFRAARYREDPLGNRVGDRGNPQRILGLLYDGIVSA